MRITDKTPSTTRLLRYTCFLLTCLLISIAGVANVTATVLGPCEPGLVKHWRHGFAVVLAAVPGSGESAGEPVLIKWLGHSSFLLTSPGGLRLLTDPNGYHAAVTVPDVVTVSNLHATHTDMSAVQGTPQVLWGLTPDGAWKQIALTLKDVSLFNLPSYAGRTQPENSPVHNSIFVFHLGGLCVVHLGNLRHPLTPQQLQRIGKPDVVMIPADGQWTLAYDDILTVITQLQPHLVIPMHIDFSQHAEFFVQITAGRYPVRRVPGHTLVLSRALLPAATEIVVFTAP